MHTPVFSFTFEHMHRIEPRTFASRDRLDTRAKCLSWSTRYSGQMPLLIDYILGPNAFLDGLDCHECQPQQHYFTNSQTSLRCPRVCHSFWDLHPPFKFVLRALWNKKINFCSQKQIWDIPEPRIQIIFSFQSWQLYHFERFQVEVVTVMVEWDLANPIAETEEWD